MDVQKQIRENTLELQEFLKDLKGWESTVKEKEKHLKNPGSLNGSKNQTPLPRKNPSISSGVEGRDVQEVAVDQATVKELMPKSRKIKAEETKQGAPSKAGATAASHTYDYFRDKWDKFDVNAALKEIDDNEDGDLKKSPAKIVHPVRGSQSKRNITEGTQDTFEVASKSHKMEKGKIFGRGIGPMAPVDQLSDVLGYDEGPPDAASEKELGNDYFKEGKYVRAIDCYSRSIALQPTAVAYANRAMSALKIRRYEDAELDCSEAISLDDRYTKAYARRGTARKELKKYLPAVEDFEFALRLEPENKELRRQYMEVKELHEKESGIKPSQKRVPIVVREVKGTSSISAQPPPEGVPMATPVENIPTPQLQPGLPTSADKTVVPLVGPRSTSSRDPGKLITNVNPVLTSRSSALTADTKSKPNSQGKPTDRKSAEAAAITQAAAARAAASAMAALSRNMVAPRSSYEFETMWKGFDGNRDAQSRLLKAMDPFSLPKVFKDSLSALLMVEIIHSLEPLFIEDAKFGIQILENLTKVGRFSMTVMFLSGKDKSELGNLWDQVFMKAPAELHNQLVSLRATYCG